MISVFIERLNDLYKIEVTNIKSMENQTRKLFKLVAGEWKAVEDENYLLKLPTPIRCVEP